MTAETKPTVPGAVAGGLAIDGGPAVRNAPFPTWPVWDERDERAVLDALRSGKWGAHAGSRVAEFGRRFATFQQAGHAVCVTNGTAALEVALRAVGVGPLDEVIIPPYTFVATATAVLSIGAIPVFCDILPDTYLIDAADAERRVTPRTRAIVPVHIAGQPADLDAVGAVAGRHGLKVVEDAAQAHGAAWQGRRVGAIGDAGTFSFQSSKNLNAGEGGVVLTDDRAVAERAWSLANVGRIPDGAWYQHEVMGFNLRLTELQGALLLAQMERLPEQFERRERNARLLDRELSRVPGITPQARDERVTGHAHHLYLFRYDGDAFGERPREWFLRALRAEGIPCSPGYTTPLYRMNAVRDERRKWATVARDSGRPVAVPETADEEALPVTERACAAEGVWLTQNVLLGSEADMAQIVEAVAKVQRLAPAVA
jgi:dTDP-4-amino-4,6-dideoxygalactose transaminase